MPSVFNEKIVFSDNMLTALSQLYDSLFNRSINQIAEGNILVDRLINTNSDNRRGLTLLIRPTQGIKDKIRVFQEEMSRIDPEQYYQPASDLHITALSIISCYDGFDLSQINAQDYVDVILESLKEIGPINLRFKGITASQEAVMIQGFAMDDGLDLLRDRLRMNFRYTDLQQSIDSRYKLSTAHMTSVRFQKKLQLPAEFAAALQCYREADFGQMQIGSLDLVYNDWYQKSKIVKTLYRFNL